MAHLAGSARTLPGRKLKRFKKRYQKWRKRMADEQERQGREYEFSERVGELFYTRAPGRIVKDGKVITQSAIEQWDEVGSWSKMPAATKEALKMEIKRYGKEPILKDIIWGRMNIKPHVYDDHKETDNFLRDTATFIKESPDQGEPEVKLDDYLSWKPAMERVSVWNDADAPYTAFRTP